MIYLCGGVCVCVLNFQLLKNITDLQCVLLCEKLVRKGQKSVKTSKHAGETACQSGRQKHYYIRIHKNSTYYVG